MARLSDLPLELRLMILEHCSIETWVAFFLVSKQWHDTVLTTTLWEPRVKQGYYRETIQDKNAPTGPELFKILGQYRLAALEEWALRNEPEVEIACAAIHASKATDEAKQALLEQHAKQSATAARWILFNPPYWAFIQDQAARATFIQAVMGEWPEAIYYALENETLRQEWLPFVKNTEFLVGMLRKGSTSVAWLWSTNVELRQLLAVHSPHNLVSCVRSIMQAGGEQVALLWSTDVELRQLLVALNSPYHLLFCVKTIIKAGGKPVALLWSTDVELRRQLAAVRYPFHLHYCVKAIIQAGGEQIALLWSTKAELRDIIAGITEKRYRLKCLDVLIEIGGNAARAGCLADSILAKDVPRLSSLRLG